MRKLLAVAACGVGIWAFGACGGGDGDGAGSISDPVEACKQIKATMCDVYFSSGCFTKQQLDAAQPTIGLNATDCRDKLEPPCTPAQANCDSGETFHADKAQTCIDGLKTLSCNDLAKNPIPTPAACDQVCTN
jgi:hypothetical protein